MSVRSRPNGEDMRAPIVLLALLALAALAGPAGAACFADYKAKRDDPLRLHYGVIELPDDACSAKAAAPLIARRIAADGWELLNVLGVFGREGLAEREESAGRFFLRY